MINDRLPVTVANVPGAYRIWAKNPDGSATEKFRFNIVEPSLPPQIYEWAPKVITSWMHWLDVLPEGR